MLAASASAANLGASPMRLRSCCRVFARGLGVALVALVLVAHAAPAAMAQRGGVIDFAKGDAEMAAAIAKARKSLPTFWQRLAKPGPGEQGFSVKVGVPVGGNNTEHIWVANVQKLKDGRYSGRFANQPRDIKGKKIGDAVAFSEGQISDWMFTRRGKIVGAETLRPMLKRLPPAQADQLRARLESP
jgi:uncharacterized protein YegJ (DUF2314 family)